MRITKDTIVCISVAEYPGNFGAKLFNSIFDELEMDFIYKPFKVFPRDLNKAIDAIKVFGIRGCGVSMPHKSAVMPLLDIVDPVAKMIGAVNTIVNDEGKLTGYNTDYFGAKTGLSNAIEMKGKTAVIIGSGGASRAIIVALKELGASEITVLSRDDIDAEKLAKEFSILSTSYSKKDQIKANLLVNATPVGMSPNTSETIINVDSIDNFEAVLDVVVSPLKTKLIEMAEKSGKVVIPGYRMSMYQAIEQFKYYTKVEPSMDFVENEMKRILS